jgi:hypothetical protein
MDPVLKFLCRALFSEEDDAAKKAEPSEGSWLQRM